MPQDPSQRKDSLAVVILAAGAGKRFRSPIPKVLHKAAGLPLVQHVLSAAATLENVSTTIVVVGKQAQMVGELVSGLNSAAVLVNQTELLGTGDAVKRCASALEGFQGCVLTLAGDAPLITPATLRRLVGVHRQSGAPVSLLTAHVPDPTGYGRILRDADGLCVGVVEHADASAGQKLISEISSGVWCFDKESLFDALERIGNNNAQGEYYLPEAAALIARSHGSIATVPAGDPAEIEGVNDRRQLAAASRVLWIRKADELMLEGVTLLDPATTYVDAGVTVGPDSTLRPLTFLEGVTQVGSGCSIGPCTRVIDSVVEDGAEVTMAVIRQCHIGPGASVGPFTSLRPGTRLGAKTRAGSFVEIKGSTIGEGSKVPHLSYVGDAEIGVGVNLGAGTITANYDSESKVKSRTVIGDGAFTGSDTTLIAPVNLGKNSGTGAGSVVTRDVSDGQIVAGVPARPMRDRKTKDGTG